MLATDKDSNIITVTILFYEIFWFKTDHKYVAFRPTRIYGPSHFLAMTAEYIVSLSITQGTKYTQREKVAISHVLPLEDTHTASHSQL